MGDACDVSRTPPSFPPGERGCILISGKCGTHFRRGSNFKGVYSGKGCKVRDSGNIFWQHSCTACTSLAALHGLISTRSCLRSNAYTNEPTDRLTKLFEHIRARIRQVLGLSDFARIGWSICYLPVLSPSSGAPFCEMKRVRLRRHTRQSHTHKYCLCPRPTFSPDLISEMKERKQRSIIRPTTTEAL